MARAFRVELPQVEAPDFARDEYFEVQATIPQGATREQVPEMLQTMLAERFKLAYHRETREYQMSVLTVGKRPGSERTSIHSSPSPLGLT